ncbi:MAG TPA: hypothetical protein VHD61_08870 [Lacunisphaera sp.]|nr:hypothetical protein [Lacunisphaera sp.]
MSEHHPAEGRPDEGARRAAGRVENAAVAALLALAAWFYFWTATSAGSPLTFDRPAYDLYNRLADGFLAGHTYFPEAPPPELAQLADPYDPAQNAPYKKYHDVSYYRGHYYLYFGPTPALVLLAPWKLLTGTSLPQNLAVAAFAWGSGLLGVLLLRGLRDRHFPGTPRWVFVAAAAAVLLGDLFPVLLRRPVYYELAIASATFFSLAAMGCFFRAVGGGRSRASWLAGAGLGLGLAVAGRPNCLFGVAAFLAAWGWLRWQRERPRDPAGWWRCLAAMAPLLLPLGLVGLGLAAYNQARFGSFLEFGMKYQLAGGNQLHLRLLNPAFVPVNLYYYLWAPPQLSAYFPFIQVTPLLPFHAPAGYTGEENMYGLLFSVPWLLAGGWLHRAVRERAGVDAGALREFAVCASAWIAGVIVFLLQTAAANNRYLLDFVPLGMVLAGTGVLAGEARDPGWRRSLARLGWGAALAWTVLFNVFVSLQHNDLLAYHNPVTYRRLAHAFNHWSQWLGLDRRGPLRIDLTWPKNRTGKLEPLVVTGLSFRADFLYVFYKDDAHLQLGFEHTSYGGKLTDPIAVDYDLPHELGVEMGSLYPPVDHPQFDGVAPDTIDRRKHTLRVTLDGRVVLEGRFDFYESSPGDVTIGRNTVSDAFGRRFTGVVRSVTRRPEP